MSLTSNFLTSLFSKILKTGKSAVESCCDNDLYDYIAIDFEAANYQRDPCQVGLAMIKDGKIVNTFSSLINPHTDFDIGCINIHGITKISVVNAPNFKDIYFEVLQPLLNKYPFVAHNAAFDRDVLIKACAKIGVDATATKFYCTLSISRRYFPTLGNYKLDDLCDAFGVELKNHHDAEADAVACALIFLCLIENYNIELFPLNPYKNGCPRTYTARKNTKFICPVVTYDDCEIIVKANKFALSGDIEDWKRNDIIAAIENAGGIYSKTVTKTTDYLAVGIEDRNLVADKITGKTQKIIQAEALRADGSSVKIIQMENLVAALQR